MKKPKIHVVTLSVSLKDPKISEIVEMLKPNAKAFKDWQMRGSRLTMKSNPEENELSHEVFVKIMGMSTTYKLS